MKNLVKNVDQLRQIVNLTPDEEEAVRRKLDLKLGITPHFAALMDPDGPLCPIRLQVVPTMAEFALDDPDLNDPLGEDSHMPVPGLVHRYPDRVLIDITDQCVSYCRHCTRRRLVGTGTLPVTRARTELIAQYLEAHPEVRDALILRWRWPFHRRRSSRVCAKALTQHQVIGDHSFWHTGADLFAPAHHGTPRKYHQEIPPYLGEHPHQSPERTHSEVTRGLRQVGGCGDSAGQPNGLARGHQRLRELDEDVDAAIGADARSPVLPLPVRFVARDWALSHASLRGRFNHRGTARPYVRLCSAEFCGGRTRRRWQDSSNA